MDTVTAEDLTVRDLFSQAQLEEVAYNPEIAALYCQYILEGKSLIGAATEIWRLDNEAEYQELMDMVENRVIDHNFMMHKLKMKASVIYKRMNRWRIAVQKFDDMVNLAMRQRCYHFMEDILEIADDSSDDVVMGVQGPIINGKAIRRAELMIGTRKFVMAKMLPKVFGDKTQMELTGADGKDLGPTTFTVSLVPTGSFISQDQAAKAAEERDNGV